MKLSHSILSIAFASVVFIGCKDTASKPAENATTEAKKEVAEAKNPQTATFHIEGMTCSMGCAKTIEEKLTEMDGVQKAKVDFEAKTAVVNFDMDKLKSEDLVAAAESCADGKTYKVSDVKVGN